MKKFLTGFCLGIAFFLVLYFLLVFLPGALQGTILVDPYIFKIGSFYVRWYGFLIATGVLIAYLVSDKTMRKKGFTSVQIEGTFLILIIFGVIGARIGYIIQSTNYFSQHLPEIFKLWDGGLSIHGAILGGIAGLLIAAKTYHYNAALAANIITPQLFLAGAIGRFGNFFNSEIIGQPTTIWWKMFVPDTSRPFGFENHSYFHPVFLYEAILFLFFYFIYILISKKTGIKYGFAYTMVFYSLTRVIIEFWRIDYRPILGPFDLAQLVSFGIILIGLAIGLVTLTKRKI